MKSIRVVLLLSPLLNIKVNVFTRIGILPALFPDWRKIHRGDLFGDRYACVKIFWHVRKLVITGLQTAYCVDTTCRRAYSLGYETVLVSDGHSTLDSDILKASQIIAHHNEVLGSQFATVLSASEVTFD